LRKLKNGPLLGLLRLFRGLRHVPGGHGIVADPQSWPGAPARSRRSHLPIARSPAGAHWLWPACADLSERSPSDAHPLARHGSRRRHCDQSRALRRHVLATALLRPNQSPHAKHYEHDPQSHDRLDLPFARRRHTCAARSGPGSFGRAPLLRFPCPLQRSLAALALSGAAGLRTIPLRRFIPTRRPARLLCAFAPQWPSGADDLTRALAVFRFRRIPCDAAHVADATGATGRSSRIRRSPIGYVPCLASAGHVGLAWRRVDGLLLGPPTSSIARAGETGVTGPSRHPPAGTPATDVSRHVVTLARDPYH
jgi:hypothetical protein